MPIGQQLKRQLAESERKFSGNYLAVTVRHNGLFQCHFSFMHHHRQLSQNE